MKAVIFDLFETLITENVYKYTIREVSSDLEVDYALFREEWHATQTDRNLGKLSGTTQIYRQILENLGLTRDENLLKEVTRKREACKRKGFETVEPEIMDMLSVIKEKGYKTELISNCSFDEIQGLRDSELYAYLDVAVLSCDVGLVKPDIKIYEYCASLLGEQPPDCFFVGDGGSDELNGAKKTGMVPLKALWFTKHFIKDFDADKTYQSFSEPSDITTYIIEAYGL